MRKKIVSASFSILMFFLLLLCNENTLAQAANFPEKNGIIFSPRWLNNLVFLNNMTEGKISPEDQMLYLWAETALAGKKSDSYSSLGNNRWFQSYCSENSIVHMGGPMLGNISPNSADVWVRTVKPDTIFIKVKIGDNWKNVEPVITSEASELAGVVKITGLKPNTSYPYQVFVGNHRLVLPENASIKTTPESRSEITRIAFGSCFHRWGLGNMNQMNTIVSRRPHAFVGLGDIAAQDKMNMIGWHSLDYLARDLYPAWKKLVAQVPFYALWDDHDYFGDDLSGIPRGFDQQDKENVWKVFRHAWVNPSYGLGDSSKGVFLEPVLVLQT